MSEGKAQAGKVAEGKRREAFNRIENALRQEPFAEHFLVALREATALAADERVTGGYEGPACALLKSLNAIQAAVDAGGEVNPIWLEKAAKDANAASKPKVARKIEIKGF